MKRTNFTLVELLVSLGVFSILLLVFMQLFNSMRQGIEKTEKQVDTRYSVTVSMDTFSNIISKAPLRMPIVIACSSVAPLATASSIA